MTGPNGPHEEGRLFKVVDADTAWVWLDGKEEPQKVRFLAVDTEESYDTDYKTSSPFGLETKRWAKKHLEVGMPIRIEYDPERPRTGAFGRLLGHVWYKAEGREWQNLNYELVGRGLSPFSVKYGFPGKSRTDPNTRAFLAIQDLAREQGYGLWDPNAVAPVAEGGYEETLELWLDRATALETWDHQVEKQRPDIHTPRREGDYQALAGRAGDTVTMFSAYFEPLDPSPYPTTLDQLEEPIQPAVFQMEGSKGETWKIVVEPPKTEADRQQFVETVAKLVESLRYFRYLRGTIKADPEALTLLVSRPQDVTSSAPVPG